MHNTSIEYNKMHNKTISWNDNWILIFICFVGRLLLSTSSYSSFTTTSFLIQMLNMDKRLFKNWVLHIELSLVPIVIFILWGGSITLWISFFHHNVFDSRRFRFMFIGVNLELSSFVLRNKSHPSFLVGGCTGPFR